MHIRYLYTVNSIFKYIPCRYNILFTIDKPTMFPEQTRKSWNSRTDRNSFFELSRDRITNML